MSTITFSIKHYRFLFPGVSEKEPLSNWIEKKAPIMPLEKIEFEKRLPMMISRRLSKGTQLAIEVALRVQEFDPDFQSIVFSSRHAELIRNEKLLKIIGQDQETSPTDFSMSVHNSACGMFCVHKHLKVPATSIAAGADSFHMACVEAYGILKSGTKKVLLLDFEGGVPPLLGATFPQTMKNGFAYAVGFILENGREWEMQFEGSSNLSEPSMPSSLQFLRSYVLGERKIEAVGGTTKVIWSKNAG